MVKKKNRGQLPWSLKHLVEGKKKCQKHFPFSKTQTGCFKTKILLFIRETIPFIMSKFLLSKDAKHPT